MTLDQQLQKLKHKSPWNYDHSMRVADVTYNLALEINYFAPERMYLLGKYHDVGKSQIPDKILNKKGGMNRFERIIINTHSGLSADILSADGYPELSEFARYHHESLDGAGPNGLDGKDIPFESQIVGVADYFDAILYARPYKKPMSLKNALRHMVDLKGVKYKPRVVDGLVRMFGPATFAPSKYADRRKTYQLDEVACLN